MTKPTTSKPAATVHNLPVQTRAAELVPTTYNEADNTIDVVWTTGSRVKRYDYWNDTPYEEELVVDAASVDMSRFDAGTVQVLDGHQTYGGIAAILGVATRASIENGQGLATLRLSNRPEIAGLIADIKAGIIRSISFGYAVKKYEIVRAIDRTDGVNMPLYRAVSWQPYEISFVTVPADANASTRSQPQPPLLNGGMPCEFSRAFAQSNEEPKMTQEEIEAQRVAQEAAATANNAAQAAAATRAAQEAMQRAADITDVCTRHGVSQLATKLIRDNSTVDQARAAVLEELAKRDASQGGNTNVRIQTVTDEHETRLRGIEESILNRVDSKATLTDNGRQYRGMSLLEIGRDYLHSRGVDTRGMDRMSLATRVLQYRGGGLHGTSDFANLLANVANKRLRNAYDDNAGTYKIWARKAPNAPDFKNILVTQLSGAPDLLRTNEHGEFKYGSMGDTGENYNLLTYGRIIGFSRQSIINDDLRGFDRLISAFGSSASRLENRTAYAQLTSNPVLSDSFALFQAANHFNLATGAPSALQISSLTTARAAIRIQKGLQGEELNLIPSYLIVPAALEQTAYQVTSPSQAPTKATDVNEFRQGGRTALTPIVEPILDANSLTAWYLASENSQIDTVEFCYLDGAEGPVIESDVGFDVDGISYKCRLDFAAKAVDFRGLYKSNGV